MIAVAALVVSGALTACGSGPPQAEPGPLRILIVNANGWTAPGVAALRDSLRRSGHTVVQVSPVSDRSAAGTAVTPPPTEIAASTPTPDHDVWVTTGTATDGALFALKTVMGSNPPDLVITGIDSSPNVSVSALHSGTVGAAMTAAELGLPAIAISADLDGVNKTRPAAYAPSAAFAARLVRALSQRPVGAPLMPIHTVLNVNYPGDHPRGVVAVTTAGVPDTTVGFRAGRRPGTFVAVDTPRQVEHDDHDDVGGLSQGKVTLSDLSADPDRTAPPPRTAALLAPKLAP